MDDFDLELDARMDKLLHQVTARTDPPSLKRQTRLGRLALSLTMGPMLAFAVFATAAGAAIVVSNIVGGYPGVQDPGQALAGSHMECMTPREAAAFLATRGFVDVVWQVESGDPANGTSATNQQPTAPEHGFVIPGSILSDGRLHMVIDQRAGATGVGACAYEPMP